MSDEKWKSPTGNPISSSETDRPHHPAEGMEFTQVTKQTENVSCENLTNAADSDLLADALRALDFIEAQSYKPEHKQKSITDCVHVVHNALSLSKQMVEVLKKANFTYLGNEYVACLKPDIVNDFLAKLGRLEGFGENVDVGTLWNTRAAHTIEPIDGLEEAIDILEVHMADMGDMAVVLVAARAYLALTKRGG